MNSKATGHKIVNLMVYVYVAENQEERGREDIVIMGINMSARILGVEDAHMDGGVFRRLIIAVLGMTI